MADLIERSAVIDAMEQAKSTYCDRRVIIGKMQDVVRGITAADAVPVVHGRWIFGKDDETGERDVYAWTCSLCGEKYPWRPHYCPNCGADMRDGKDEA